MERDGFYFWYFSHGNKTTGVMRAEHPEGPYIDLLGKPIMDSFDPTIFVDDDGTHYIINGHGDYKIARLKDSMIELDRKDTFPIMDKNSLHKHNGIYYLSCSGYYATSDSVYGPYEYKGLVGEGFERDTPYGHGDFFEWKGDWYHVWCAYRDRSIDRIRDCFLSKVQYGEDGSIVDEL